jgi:hypothetical protein
MPDDFDIAHASDDEKRAYAAGLNASTRPPLTRDEIRSMSAQEIMARKREVDEVLKRGVEVVSDDD